MAEHRHGVSLVQAWRVWLRVAALSFGGPAGQIAVMHRIIVDEKKWVGESRFLHALSYCMLLPGPEAQQLATYIGWLMHRWPGAIIADRRTQANRSRPAPSMLGPRSKGR
jgi:chromate transporter